MIKNLTYLKIVEPYVNKKGEQKNGGYTLHLQGEKVHDALQVGIPFEEIYVPREIMSNEQLKQLISAIPCQIQLNYGFELFNGRPYARLQSVEMINTKK